MTKIEVIKALTEKGIFESAHGILDIISADNNPDHASANRDIAGLIRRIHKMSDWTQFSWKEMIDLVAQAYGFTKYLAYSGIDACADVADEIEELHTIVWNNLSSMKVWNG